MTRKLKDWVIPTLSLFVLIGGFFTYTLINRLINYNDPEVVPTVELSEDETINVDNDVTDNVAIKPYTDTNVEISKYYYKNSDQEEKQIKSLIRYENIYMPNTGILYRNNNEFSINSILDGTITNIKEDEILGNIIEIEHENNLVSVYENVTNITLKVGDKVKKGDVIATSLPNKLDNDNGYALHFEVYKEGKIVNPEEIFNS